MFPSISTLGEFLIAPTAGMQFLPTMDHEVSFESILVPERLPTVVARIRSPTRQVQLSVTGQHRCISELLATIGAFVRLLSRVEPLVFDEMGFLCEVLVA